jgi:hypothetical protein
MFFTISIFSNELVEVYLPHNQWKLIGVPGPFFEGSNSADTFSSTSWYEATDLNAGSRYIALTDTGGTVSICDETADVFCFSLEDSSYSQIIMASEVNNSNINTYIPRRDMYVSFDTGVDLNISYQADLEGNSFEIKIFEDVSTSKIYEGILNSSYNYSNPAYLTEKSGTSSTYTLDLRNDSVIDMNLTNNPGKPGQSGDIWDYEENTHRDEIDTTRDEYIQMFGLNSVVGYWEVFNSKYADSYNDFTALESGKGYWIKVNNGGIDKENGLILGDGNISASSYHHKLASGWNLVSFPDGKLRESSTGLVISATANIGTNKTFMIADELGIEKVHVELFKIDNTNVTTSEIVKAINNSIASAIVDGNVSADFNVRAFALNDSTGTNAKFLMLSDRRFILYDGVDDLFDEVNTTGGQYPFDVSNNLFTSISDLPTTGVMSRYGEYALLVVPPNDGAGNLAGVKGKVVVNSNTAIDMSAETTIQGFGIQMATDTDIDNAIPVDFDLDGNLDSVLLVNSNEAFSIKDQTFTKVFRVDDTTHSSTGTLYYNDGTEDSSFTSFSVATGDTATNIKTTFDALTLTDMSSVVSGDYLFITTTNDTYSNFDIKDNSEDDLITRVTSSSNDAVGTIQAVYGISDLAKNDVNKSVYSLNFGTTGGGNTGTNDFILKIDNLETTNVLTGTGLKAGTLCMNLATEVNKLDAHVSAECNTSTASDLNTTLTISGYFTQAGVKEDDANITGTADNAYDYASDFTSYGIGGSSYKDSQTLIDDLRAVAIYTPDLSTSNGVLSYIRENNFTVDKILTAINNTDGSSVSWKYIDLTTPVDSWLTGGFSYDLFEIEQERGYFAFLSENNTTTITITPDFELSFSQHYNNDNNYSGFSNAGEVQNFADGVLDVTISGDEGSNTRVVANIQGKEYLMTEESSKYTIAIDSEDMPDLYQADSNITISAYDIYGGSASKQVELNLSAPATPVFGFFEAGKIAFLGTSSSDLRGFHIYSGDIDERYPTPSNTDGTTYVKDLTASNDYKTNTTSGTEYCYDNTGTGAGCPTSSIPYGKTLYVRSNVSGKTSIAGNYGTSGTAKVCGYTSSSVGHVFPNATSCTVTSTSSNPTLYFLTYNICEDAPDFDTNNTGWKFVAYDGSGTVSNIQFLPDWYSIYKNASILSVTDTSTVDNTPRLYDSSCEASSSNSIKDNGVVLTDANTGDDTNITVAYDTVTSASITQAHAQRLGHVYIQYKNDTIAKLQYSASDYVSTYNGGTVKKIIFDVNNSRLFVASFDDLNASYIYDLNDSAIKLDSNQTIVKGK